MAYISSDGKIYKDKQEYYNSDDLETMEIFMYLYHGKRQPQNSEEQKWLEDMKELDRQGKILDFPMGTF